MIRSGIAYLNTLYPALSHTFIEREVRAVRAAGVAVRTFSIRRPTEHDKIGASHEAAARETTYLLDGRWAVFSCQLRQIVRRPLRYLRALLASQDLSPMGLKNRMLHLMYTMQAARLVEAMNRFRITHVHVHMANNGAAVALLASKLDTQITYSLSIHGSAEFFNVNAVALKPKVENARFVRCISDFCKAQIMIWTDVSVWHRLHVVHCGVDPQKLAPIAHWQPDVAARPLRLLTVGRLVPIKGYPVLLQACADLSKMGIDWNLTMVGVGPMQEELERRIQENGIAGRVRLAGAVSQEQMPRYLEQADVMIVCSLMEGVPVVLMEAMAKELAVVATAVGGIPELIDDGKTGLLVRPASAEQLAAALGRLARDRSLVKTFGQVARRRIVEQFSIDCVGDQMRGLFERHGVLSPAGQVAEVVAQQHPRRYVIIAPCRDEAAFCRKTLDSILAQSVRPELCVIVDDGSTDDTPKILEEYARRYDYIRVIRRDNRGRRSVGPGVVDAFYAGLETVDLDQFDYVCKLDLDLDLPPRYFELLIERMESEPRLGACSGKPYYRNSSGMLVSEGCGDESAIGASKFYRVSCFCQIGGFVRQVMWDGIDGHRCRMLGWIAASWDDDAIRFEHLRPMGSSHRGILTGRARHGLGQYFMGTGPGYMLVSSLFRMTRPPVLVGGLAMLWGYWRALLTRQQRYDDSEFRRFLRRYQRACLLRGKRRATQLLNQRQITVWSPSIVWPTPSERSASRTKAIDWMGDLLTSTRASQHS